MEIKTIKELYEKVKSGEIDESQLSIVLDNDFTGFYLTNPDDEDDPIKIVVREASGYRDVEPLYRLLFPIADVDGC